MFGAESVEGEGRDVAAPETGTTEDGGADGMQEGERSTIR